MEKRVTGIGGIFFKCKSPENIKDWYKEHLGLHTDGYGTSFEWRQSDDPNKKGFSQWSPFSDHTTFMLPLDKDHMINYRVENLERLHKQLVSEGVEILDDIETYDYGKFLHILDCEGNKIELWEPIDEAFDKIVNGRTK